MTVVAVRDDGGGKFGMTVVENTFTMLRPIGTPLQRSELTAELQVGMK